MEKGSPYYGKRLAYCGIRPGYCGEGDCPHLFPFRPTEMLRYSVLLYCIFFFFLELVDWKKCRYNYYK